MVFERVQSKKDRPVEGVVDVGVIVIAHFQNPAQKQALDFMREVLLWKKKCLIPTSTVLGAYHILTSYIGVERSSACGALLKTLRTLSPAFYYDINLELASEAILNATRYRVASWDGYIISLARKHQAPIIYTIDTKLAKRVKDITFVNPISEETFRKYNEWLERKLAYRKS